MPDSDCWK